MPQLHVASFSLERKTKIAHLIYNFEVNKYSKLLMVGVLVLKVDGIRKYLLILINLLIFIEYFFYSNEKLAKWN